MYFSVEDGIWMGAEHFFSPVLSQLPFIFIKTECCKIKWKDSLNPPQIYAVLITCACDTSLSIRTSPIGYN